MTRILDSNNHYIGVANPFLDTKELTSWLVTFSKWLSHQDELAAIIRGQRASTTTPAAVIHWGGKMRENLGVPAYSLRRKCLMTEKKLRLTKDGQHQSRSAVSSKWPTSSVGFPKQSNVCTAVLVSALLASVPSVKPVLNWAHVCSPEHTSDTSTNYDSFLN